MLEPRGILEWGRLRSSMCICARVPESMCTTHVGVTNDPEGL